MPASRKRTPIGFMWRVAIYGGAVVAIVGGTLLFAILRGPTQGKLLYYQYRVANARPPASQVVFQFSPVLNEVMNPTGLFSIPLKAASVAHHGADDDDDCELLPPHVVPIGGVGESAELDMFNQFLDFPLTDDMQVLFAHVRTGAGGEKRIVIVEYGIDPRGKLGQMAFEILVIEPATLSAPPHLLTRQRIAGGDLHFGYARTTCYAGQVDDRDPALFHLAFELGGGRRTITGALDKAGKRVELREDSASVAAR